MKRRIVTGLRAIEVRLSRALYRLLLRAYSPRFRRLYGADMTRAFLLQLERADAAGRLAKLRCWAVALRDFARNAPADRLHSLGGRFVGVRSLGVRSAISDPPLHALRPRGDHMLARTLQDARFALRTMARQPVAAAMILVTLALGTGATIAIFSVVDAALLRPLPYPESGRMAAIVQVSEDFGLVPFAPPFLDDLRARSNGFASLAGFSSSGWLMTMLGAGEPRVVEAAYVSDGLFEMLGARPVRGRLLSGDDHTAGGARVALVSSALWASAFGEHTELEGQTVRLSGTQYRVVGVLPPDFSLPITGSIVSPDARGADVLLPLVGHWFTELRNIPIMNVIGRLAPGATLESAGAEIEALRPALAADFPEAELAPRFRTVALAELVTAPSRVTVLLLFGAAALLLLIACVNVANLMLARATSRRHEIAVRSALGAGRGRLAAQVFTEALVFAGLGCGAGLLLAGRLLSAVPALGLQALPPTARVEVDGRVAAFAALLALTCAVLSGLVPMLYSRRVSVAGRLRSGALQMTGTGAHARSGLVVVEVALAVVLLVLAGLLSTSFWHLSRVDPGFRADGLVSVPLAIADAGYEEAGARGAFMIEVLERLSTLPGVERVAGVNRLPLGGGNVLVAIEAEGQAPPEDVSTTVDRRVVTPGYFDLMGIELVAGRDFTAADDAQSDFGAAIVNRTAMRTFWPEGEVVGRRLRLMLRGGPGPWLTVVGVVADVRHHGLDEPARPEIYVPYQQARVETMVALVRSAPDVGGVPGNLEDVIKLAAWQLDEDLPMDGIARVDEVVQASVSEPRLRTAILVGFAALAALLAAVGIAGVVSHAVVQRRRDIALRVALGARRDQILRQTVRQGLVLGLIGAALGLLVATWLTRVIDSLLFEVGSHDPLTFAGVTTLLLLIVIVASYLPARQATRVDPMIALRSE